jgi:hypothetical protein
VDVGARGRGSATDTAARRAWGWADGGGASQGGDVEGGDQV